CARWGEGYCSGAVCYQLYHFDNW
nr:immunoglobulin heavy chain junction region [Macaca mulatta]MOX91645.1 immunoglobulin heavy chain junction region [Macaca mulatta]MOX91883.1 immunoglobulin heavy chain junction region [Macaca mulatta]MOX92125.1 immunoglobulin heavy chain junction region [Macaca mulatta]MOX92335.1 immunoglobulin heavy chain junction region [Macaca mulatta]